MMKIHSKLWYQIRGSFKGGTQKGAGWLLTNPGARATEYYMATLKLSKLNVENLTHIPASVIPSVENGMILNVDGAFLTTEEWNYIAQILQSVAKTKGITLYDDSEFTSHENKHSDITHF